jgi:hypothetical protein
MLSTDFEENLHELSRIVTALRGKWEDGVTESDIKEAIAGLYRIRKIDFKKKGKPLTKQCYKYDDTKFPPIPQEQTFSAPNHAVTKNSGPRTLAEALLWKKGDWSKYVDFVNDFNSASFEPQSRDSGPVFFAFAEHLKDRDVFPILDQHSARALWVLSDDQWNLEKEPYRHFLLDGKNGAEQWRTSPAPKIAANLVISNFWISVKSTCATAQIDLSMLDQLLMPLGQALKHYSKKKSPNSHYDGLIEITGLIAAQRCHAPKKL